MMQDIIRDFSEKRDFIRMKVDTEINVRTTDGQNYKAICRDLSGTGMSFETDQKFEEGTELYTSIPSNNPAFPSLETSVKVIRCVTSEDGNYRIGTEILKIQN